MTNLWYDFDLSDQTPVTPFVGVGIGAAHLDADHSVHVEFPSFTATSHTSADDWVFVWQAGAGLGYEFGNGMIISAQCRYFATGDADIGGGQDVSVNAHEALIGLNIPLGN